MKKAINYGVWITTLIVLVMQESLYYETLLHIRINSFDIWNVNIVTPNLITLTICVLLYSIVLKFLVKKDIRSHFNSLNIGIIALISVSFIYIPLYINKLGEGGREAAKEYPIIRYGMKSGGKNSDSYPYVLIDTGKPYKQLVFEDYNVNAISSRKSAVLIVKEGSLGWDIIQSITLE